MKKRPSYVDVKVVTWQKDSHGLFDYESKSHQQSQHNVQKSCVLARNKKDSTFAILDQTVDYGSLEENDRNPFIPLAAMEIDLNSHSYSFKKNAREVLQGNSKAYDPYIVIRSLKNQQKEQRGYELVLGDVIKFGRLEYIVREFRDHHNTQTHGSMKIDFSTHQAKDESPEGTCKVCLGDQQTPDNFMVSPCNCKGSCQLIHIQCLKQWIQSKIVKQTQGIVESYNFTKFQCEICKVAFPQKIIKKNVQYPMLIIPRPNHPYIILQNLSQKKDHRNMHLISFKTSNTPLKLGRGHECQIRLTDISVSRVHAQLKFQNSKFIIFDNSSKFGTLIKIQGNIPITQSKTAFQIGRTVVICCLKNRGATNNDPRKITEQSFKRISEESFRRTK